MDIEKNPQSQHCLECGLAVHGRVDKRFCDDSCRALFNNRRRQTAAAGEPAFLKDISKILLRNYHILRQLYPGQKTQIKRKDLERMGFNFRFMTSYYKTSEGDMYHFCFDLGYLPIRGEMVLIVSQPSQVLS
ncbi:DUF2116 family Zn-ribbon domain-containing protein [Pedobacter sp. GSP4]|uniref:DUF2116 family Zn-ribbon domain-containing protein n=1 Tax=Pedobacter sp. GSP4 TaxID=3453716 RepID=UPI003EED669A